jgi:uncharacterized glyoxalase superfamily protein PhnB
MKIDAIGVTSSTLKHTVEFYRLLGFQFPEVGEDEDHVEAEGISGSARLMIDTKKSMAEILGQQPTPANHGAFAVHYDTPAEIDAVASKVKAAGFTVIKEPWDAFWGQRYAVVADPDGYQIDLYSPL